MSGIRESDEFMMALRGGLAVVTSPGIELIDDFLSFRKDRQVAEKLKLFETLLEMRF